MRYISLHSSKETHLQQANWSHNRKANLHSTQKNTDQRNKREIINDITECVSGIL